MNYLKIKLIKSLHYTAAYETMFAHGELRNRKITGRPRIEVGRYSVDENNYHLYLKNNLFHFEMKFTI